MLALRYFAFNWSETTEWSRISLVCSAPAMNRADVETRAATAPVFSEVGNRKKMNATPCNRAYV